MCVLFESKKLKEKGNESRKKERKEKKFTVLFIS